MSKRNLRPSQIKAIEALNNNHSNGVLLKTMRSGKTWTILEYLKQNPNYNKILWVAENSDEKKIELERECKKLGYKNIFDKMDITLKGSIKKFSGNADLYDIVIFNECHGITEKVKEHLKMFICPIIGLTGTYPTQFKKISMFRELGLNNIIYEYDLNSAIEDKAIADYQITILKVPLNDENNIKVDLPNGASFYTSEVKSYASLSKKIFESSGTSKKNLSLYRMRLLNNCQSKVDTVKSLLTKYKDNRFIVFFQDSKIAKEVLRTNYHSKTSDRFLKLFTEEKINHLGLVQKGTLGSEYRNLEGCILMSVNSSNTNIMQKISRTLIFRKDYIAKIIILVSSGTIQEQWIQKALIGVDPSKIQYVNLKRK